MATQSQMLDDDPYFEIRKPTKEERTEIKRIFSKIDANGDQKMSKHEIKRAVRYIGFNPTDADMNELMTPADVDNDGYVGYREFEKILMRAISRVEYEKQNIMNSFKMFDKNGDGYITAKELKAILSAAGGDCVDEEVNELMLEADVNKDGKISYEEFATMFCEK
ncbi:calmodulin-like [Mizuhopecten yessoensis]|uniref:Calmodulin n=1 Tax=Mizuhopecten yessoensis TaxID=6573 RepID=A0A210PSR3_MIZYE|nr:calmodulin-like [Mizuhopecten yessoensis]OWF39529.1 Calmodulin [Mizuhopecten yessoensis]